MRYSGGLVVLGVSVLLVAVLALGIGLAEGCLDPGSAVLAGLALGPQLLVSAVFVSSSAEDFSDSVHDLLVELWVASSMILSLVFSVYYILGCR